MKGLVGASTMVSTGEPSSTVEGSSTLICHCVASPFSVHERVAVEAVKAVHVRSEGVGQASNVVKEAFCHVDVSPLPQSACTLTMQEASWVSAVRS